MALHILLFNCTAPISIALGEHSILLVLDQPGSDALNCFESAIENARMMRWLQKNDPDSCFTLSLKGDWDTYDGAEDRKEELES